MERHRISFDDAFVQDHGLQHQLPRTPHTDCLWDLMRDEATFYMKDKVTKAMPDTTQVEIFTMMSMDLFLTNPVFRCSRWQQLHHAMTNPVFDYPFLVPYFSAVAIRLDRWAQEQERSRWPVFERAQDAADKKFCVTRGPDGNPVAARVPKLTPAQTVSGW